MLGKTEGDLSSNLKDLTVSQDIAIRPTCTAPCLVHGPSFVDFFVALIALCTSQLAEAITADDILCGNDPLG